MDHVKRPELCNSQNKTGGQNNDDSRVHRMQGIREIGCCRSQIKNPPADFSALNIGSKETASPGGYCNDSGAKPLNTWLKIIEPRVTRTAAARSASTTGSSPRENQ